LVQLASRADTIELSRLLSQLPARFAGRWGEKEFVLILDSGQMAAVSERLRTADIPLTLGRLHENSLNGSQMSATDIVDAARQSLA
jgi:hypothetical protein